MEIKCCSRCNELKHITCFAGDRRSKDGHVHMCKSCVSLKNQRYYQENKERVRDRTNRYYHGNKKSILDDRKQVRKSDPERFTNMGYLTKYGLDRERYDQMREQQQHSCAICGDHESLNRNSKLFVDHDHKTGGVRGLLCHGCNAGIGNLKDNADLLEKAAEYLRTTSKADAGGAPLLAPSNCTSAASRC